jgi:hypothetical protein
MCSFTSEKCLWRVYKIFIFLLLNKGVLLRYLKIENQFSCTTSDNETHKCLYEGNCEIVYEF